MADTATPSRRPSTRVLLLGGLGLVAAVLIVALGAVTVAWGDGLRDEQRLLPGTMVGGVDVGAHTIADAVAAVQEQVADRLDRPVEVTDGDRTWTTTPRQLGAVADVEQVVSAAFETTRTADLVHLVRHRFGAGDAHAHDVSLDVPDDAVAAFVAEMAREVDTAPQDAVVKWADGTAQLQDAVIGRRVQQDQAAMALEAAIAQGTATVQLPVEDHAPDYVTDEAQAVADQVRDAVDGALDHAVTVSLQDTSRTVTPRQLGAAHNAQALLDAHGARASDVALEIPDAAIDEVVDEVAAPHEQFARSAVLHWSAGGGFTSTPASTGLAVDGEEARAAVRSALQGASDEVQLQLHTTHPPITREDFDEVLLVRQPERRVELYRGGQVVRSWSVAVGTGDHPTPTGMFTIGAKRFEPTWHNPSPDSWGNEMPDSIGPGPDNPLGLRALNWNRNGVDTLIRFHGTANAGSIGQAASHGCIRMLNPDVIELYDLVDSGTVILSVAG